MHFYLIEFTKNKQKQLGNGSILLIGDSVLLVFTFRLYAVHVRLSNHRLHYDDTQDDCTQNQARHLGES